MLFSNCKSWENRPWRAQRQSFFDDRQNRK